MLHSGSASLSGFPLGCRRRDPRCPPLQCLAHYLTSTMFFVHPTTRAPLDREVCLRLDEYLEEHNLGRLHVVNTFDLVMRARKEQGELSSSSYSSNREDGRPPALSGRRREAAQILRSLFVREAGSGIPESGSSQQGDWGSSGGRSLYGGFALVDDDDDAFSAAEQRRQNGGTSGVTFDVDFPSLSSAASAPHSSRTRSRARLHDRR